MSLRPLSVGQAVLQRDLMHPCRDAMGCRPDLPITNDGPVECGLLGPAAEFDPCSDATGWRFVLDTPSDFGFVKAVEDAFQRRCGHRGCGCRDFISAAARPAPHLSGGYDSLQRLTNLL